MQFVLRMLIDFSLHVLLLYGKVGLVVEFCSYIDYICYAKYLYSPNEIVFF